MTAPEPPADDLTGAPSETLDPRLGRLIRLTHTATLHDDMERLVRYVGMIGQEFGVQGVGTAMMALVDWYGYEAGMRPGDLPPNALGVLDPFAAPGSLRQVDIDTVEPAQRWAVRVVMARLAMDEQQWRALIAAAPDNEREFGRYVLTLYRVVGENVRRVRQGFNPMPMRPR